MCCVADYLAKMAIGRLRASLARASLAFYFIVSDQYLRCHGTGPPTGLESLQLTF